MFVIPVIDLMGGVVVHARRGDRAKYLPVQSKLTPSSAPLSVVAALLDLAPFQQIYIADLDAIRHCGEHLAVVRQLAQAFTAVEFWVDAGFGSAAAVKAWMRLPIRPVVGTESLPDLNAWIEIKRLAPQAILSLDTRENQRLGPPLLFESGEHWPRDVIVMTLERVGSGRGPAMDTLAAARKRSPATNLIAAGGVRNADDLEMLREANAFAALVASAIHDGQLDAATLRKFAPA